MARVLEFQYVGAGWADAAVTLDGSRVEFRASSVLVDNLSDMTAAILALTEGASSAFWLCLEEPGLVRITCTRMGEEVEIAVDGYPELYLPSVPRDARRERLLGGRTTLSRLVSDVIEIGSRHLEAFGEDGEENGLRHPYRAADIERLKAWRRAAKANGPK